MTKTDKYKLGSLGTVRFGFSGSQLKSAFNTLLVGFPTAVARALSGDTSCLPTHMGFIYGSSGAGVPAAGWTSGDRTLTWADIASELYAESSVYNMQVSALGYTPSLSTVQNEPDSQFKNNAVTFIGMTESGASAELAFSGPGYEVTTGMENNCTIFSAVLLSKDRGVYTPLARVSLLDGTYPQKTDNRELSVFWRISLF